MGLFLVFPHVVYSLLYHTNFHLILLPVFPLISLTFVQLHGVDMSGSTVDNLKHVTVLNPLDDGLDVGVLVGEGDGAGG